VEMHDETTLNNVGRLRPGILEHLSPPVRVEVCGVEVCEWKCVSGSV
jgi:hypothetical protein